MRFSPRSKCEPHDLDFRGRLDLLVADDKIQRRGGRRFRGRRRRRNARSCCLAAGLARRAFIFFVPDLQHPNDAKLLARSRDLIDDFARRGRRGNESEFHDIALEQVRRRRRAAAGFAPAAGVAVGSAVVPRSSRKGARRKALSDSTRASSRPFTSHSIWTSSCPSNGAAASFGKAEANSSKPRKNLSGNFTLFARALSATAFIATRRCDWNSFGAIGATGATRIFSSSFNFASALA